MTGPRALRWSASGQAAAALVYAIIVAAPGVPALRQDWSSPTTRDGILDLFIRSTSGWNPHGLGAPNLYINDYLIGSASAGVDALLGPHLGLFAFMLAIGAACAFGAGALARVFGAGAWGRAAGAWFAVFNPWVYVETVAGHTYMILAYGALMGLAAECLRHRSRPLVASALAVLTLQQMQIFAAACALLVIAVRRIGWLPLVTAAAVGSPVVASLLMERSAIAGVPYSLAWERLQSVRPADALMLSGYFAGYAQALEAVDRLAMPLALCLAVFGFAIRIGSRRGGLLAAVTLIALCASTGLAGPFAGVQGVAGSLGPASLLYRELYDFLGYTAIGFVPAIGVAATRWRVAGLAAGALGVALAAAWVWGSPWSWWVRADELPGVTVAAQPNSRYALIPAFQPMRLSDGHRGSGLDPDAIGRAGGIEPMAEPVELYPVEAALARMTRRGDAHGLEELGVSQVIERPWLEEDSAAIGYGRALSTPRGRDAGVRSRRLSAVPELSLVGPPRLCTVCTDFGAGAVFAGDPGAAAIEAPTVPASPGVQAIEPSKEFVNAADGWVDARLAFAADPDLAQPFGGAVTTSRTATLAIPNGPRALVAVRGRLLDEDDRVLSRSTHGYRWIDLPSAGTTVRCDGLCVVALTAPGKLAGPAEAPRVAPVGVPFAPRTPWLLSALIPPGPPAVLRYLVRFDDGWRASADGDPLTHLRVDGYANGWLLPARARTQSLVIVHLPSAAQTVLECIGALWAVCVYAVMLWQTPARRRASPSR